MKLLCTLGFVCVSVQAFACEPEMIYGASNAAGAFELAKADAAGEIAVVAEAIGSITSPQAFTRTERASPVRVFQPTVKINLGGTLGTEPEMVIGPHRSVSPMANGAERLGFSLSRPFGTADSDLTDAIGGGPSDRDSTGGLDWGIPAAGDSPLWASAMASGHERLGFSLSRPFGNADRDLSRAMASIGAIELSEQMDAAVESTQSVFLAILVGSQGLQATPNARGPAMTHARAIAEIDPVPARPTID